MTMGHQSKILESAARLGCIALLTACLYSMATPAMALNGSHSLQQALATSNQAQFYQDHSEAGAFSLSTSSFTGRANQAAALNGNLSQLDLANNFQLDRAVELERDQRVYALLIDGTYDFNYELGEESRLHPYVQGGVGMALYGQPAVTNASLTNGGDMVPLFRLGGGIAYRLGQQWNLSLDYKTGFSGNLSSGGDQVFTGRGQQQPVDLHMLNMGMSYRF